MLTVEFLNAAKTAIKAALPGLKSCELHPGRFDADSLKRYATHTPAVLLSCLGNVRERLPNKGKRGVGKRIAAYILTSDTRLLPREQAAWNIADALNEFLPAQTFGESDRPANLETVNLWNGEIHQKGVFLLVVTWEQNIPQGQDLFQDADFLPDRLYLGEAPNIGLTHEPDYRELTHG